MAQKLTTAQDSIPKQTYFSTKGGGNVSNKSGGDYYIERMGKKPIAKKDSVKKVTPIGGSKPSVTIKKETAIKPAKPIAKNMPYKPNFVTKTDKGTGKQTRVIVGAPKVKTLPNKIQYTTDKFGKKQVVKPSNPVMKLKGK
jgi:hypothetical protein